MRALACLLVLMAWACSATPRDAPVTLGALTISGGWAPPSPNGAKTAAGYLKITNTGSTSDRLVRVTSESAAIVEMHVTTKAGAMIVMKRAPAFEVPGHGVLSLNPGAAHLMFFVLLQPFKAGETVPVRLVFEKAGAVDYRLIVRPPGEGERNAETRMKMNAM